MQWLRLFCLLLLVSCTTSHDVKEKKLSERRARLIELAKKRRELQWKKAQEARQNVAANRPSRATTENPTLPMVSSSAVIGPTKTAPKTKKSPIKSLNLKKVAASLRMPESEMRSQVYHLDRILRGERRAEQACLGSARIKNRHLCSFLTSLNSGTKSRYKSTYKPYVPINPRHFRYQQKLSYEQVQKSLRKRSSKTVLEWSSQMTKIRGCPRNLSAAALRKLEDLLPSVSAIRAMENLYKHASPCIGPNDSHYEYFHFRQALLRHLWNMPRQAAESISMAVKAKDHYERRRVLYWAGKLEKSQKLKQKHWSELISDYPLSYHALEAWRDLGKDPYTYYTQKPDMEASRDLRGRRHYRAQQGIYWLEALYLSGKRRGASILSSKLMNRFSDSYSPNNVYYVASLKEQKNNTLATIGFLSGQIRDDSAMLNEQTLKMLFPTPYFSYFQDARVSRKTDPYLLLSVARQESAFNPRARSVADARGLMQILPSTARNLSGRRWNNLYSPKTSVDLGAKYMAQLISKFGSVEKALAGYNAGPSRVRTWNARYPSEDITLYMDLIPFKETRNYVSRIVRNNYWYERIYDESKRSVASIGPVHKSSLVDSLVRNHKKSALKAYVR
ncbi:transglycosylase SLT domain-containing protein [bacterium]|nr:transglycosylase SLT domain-containing protein [bacterium]